MASEGLALSYMSEHDIPVRVVRPFQILGNGLDLEDGRLHVDFVSQLLKNNSIVLKGDGKPERTFMYVTDAITAMLRVMLVGKCGEAYNICDERGEISVLKLAEMMIQLKSGSDGDVLFDVSKRNLIEVVEAIPCVLGDSTKLRQLGFHSQYDLSNGLRRMMSAYGVEVS
jgi:nucleoside-diphosphate-sugar epimerase